MATVMEVSWRFVIPCHPHGYPAPSLRGALVPLDTIIQYIRHEGDIWRFQ